MTEPRQASCGRELGEPVVTRCLGKRAPRRDARTLCFAAYAPQNLPAPPAAVDYGVLVKSWPMYANDRCGDCTAAAAAHMVQVWSAAVGAPQQPQEPQAIDLYCRVSGFDPKTGDNDGGCVELDVLNAWRQDGLAGQRITAFVSVGVKNILHVKQALHLFGGLYLGFELPACAEGAEAWQLPPGGATGENAPGTYGGHAVNAVAYDDDGITVITWGAPLRASWAFASAYMSEAWAILSPLWLRGDGIAACGIDLDDLRHDLALVTA